MNDIIAEGFFLLSSLGTIVVMLIIIMRERRKRKEENRLRLKKQVKTTSYNKSEGYYLE
ncbi:MAG: hypothetical protein PVG70_03955 [Desulfobacterales bacterium]|jgi:hypothetical protein